MSTAYKLTETFWLKHPAIKHIIHQQFLNKLNSVAVYINATMSVYCTNVSIHTYIQLTSALFPSVLWCACTLALR